MMKNTLAWTYLVLAILTEVGGITSMKLSDGFTHWQPSILIFLFYTASLGFLTLSLKKLEIGFAYATWSGLGTFLICLIGVYYFHETMTMYKSFSLGFIIFGVMGLRQA